MGVCKEAWITSAVSLELPSQAHMCPAATFCVPPIHTLAEPLLDLSPSASAPLPLCHPASLTVARTGPSCSQTTVPVYQTLLSGHCCKIRS